MKKNQVVVDVTIKELDIILEKAEKYVSLLQEAKTLSQDLASCNLSVEIKN